jgi:hypothetical protein
VDADPPLEDQALLAPDPRHGHCMASATSAITWAWSWRATGRPLAIM